MRAGDELAGRYRLAKRLGRGGMSEVWAATDLSLDRPVAVKLLLANQADEAVAADEAYEEVDLALARFRREARTTARLHHPHIAVVHDIGMHGTRPYLVMELLAGPNLAESVRGQPGGLPLEQVLELGAQAAEALAAAHSAGVVHRDVKPANLVLDESGRVKVCDFGIAWLGDATAALTKAGMVVGTVAYMGPEQLLDEGISGQTDVYGLGATLFHLITGQVLFPGDARSVIARQLAASPPPPSTLRPGISPRLDAYLLSMLAKNPADRPAMDTVPAALRSMARVPHAWAAGLLAEAEDLAETCTPMEADAIRRRVAAVRAGWDAADAERTARRVGNPSEQAAALLAVARAVAGRDPVRASSLLAAAEQAARAIMRSSYRATRMEAIAVAVAALDPADAQRIAHSLTDADDRARTMVRIAEVTAERDPVAARRIADALGDAPHWQAQALSAVAGVVVKRDPAQAAMLLDVAEKVARSADSPERLAKGLASVAESALGLDEAQARRLLADAEQAVARIRSDLHSRKDDALGDITKVTAALSPADARRTAQAISSDLVREDALQAAARVAAASDPAEARLIATSISDPYSQVRALLTIAEAAADDAPQRAAALLAEAEYVAQAISYGSSREFALVNIAQTLARVDPAGAARIAETLVELDARALARGSAARAMAERDPPRAAALLTDAEREARAIEAADRRAYALANLAGIQAGRYPQCLVTTAMLGRAVVGLNGLGVRQLRHAEQVDLMRHDQGGLPPRATAHADERALRAPRIYVPFAPRCTNCGMIGGAQRIYSLSEHLGVGR